MFSELAKEKVLEAIDLELLESKKQHNEKFNSFHEAYAVILEELEEAKNSLRDFEIFYTDFWQNIKSDYYGNMKRNVGEMIECSRNATLEAMQVCAMCKKCLEFIESLGDAK